MGEMIERVAQALYAASYSAEVEDVAWEDTTENAREVCRKEARAAIEAMREPTIHDRRGSSMIRAHPDTDEGTVRLVPSTVRRIVGPTILLHDGAYFDFLDPQSCEFSINDVAVGLSNICRFVGQCHRFYSVAQHSCHVSDLLPEEHSYQGLMHDAPEAFLGDVAKPLKVLLPEYISLERQIEPVVFERFGVRSPVASEVNEIDVVMLATEQVQLMNNRDDWNYTRGMKPANLVIPEWTPSRARYEFLIRFDRLRPKHIAAVNPVPQSRP